MPLLRALRVLPLVAVALAACDDSSEKKSPCDGVGGACVAFEAGASADAIADAFAVATPGVTFAFAAGTFSLDLPLELRDVANVTVRGAGRDLTVLDFAGQATTGGVVAEDTDHITIRDLTVQDTDGNGVKVIGADGVHIARVKVTWTDPDTSTHGGYGLYPVDCDHVLVEESFVSGANDAGIYVGQSRDIIVRDNEATGNVAGIEIENSFRADVYGNHVHGNTGGVLVFDLPGLPQQGGHQVRVFSNLIVDNTTENFAPEGNIVGITPAGTGVIVMANAGVEIFDNVIQRNPSAGIALASYVLASGGAPLPDGYNPFPSGVSVHDNVFALNGNDPDTDTDLGLVLAGIRAGLFPGGALPDVVWDGITVPGTDPYQNPLELCFESPTAWLSLGTGLGEAGPTFSPWMQEGPTFRCALDPLPAVAPW